jgi:hypothetical protein
MDVVGMAEALAASQAAGLLVSIRTYIEMEPSSGARR